MKGGNQLENMPGIVQQYNISDSIGLFGEFHDCMGRNYIPVAKSSILPLWVNQQLLFHYSFVCGSGNIYRVYTIIRNVCDGIFTRVCMPKTVPHHLKRPGSADFLKWSPSLVIVARKLSLMSTSPLYTWCACTTETITWKRLPHWGLFYV